MMMKKYPKNNKSLLKCDKCRSNKHVIKRGIRKDGRQGFYCKSCKHNFTLFKLIGTALDYKLNKRQKEVLIGHLLGDGYLELNGANARIVIRRSKKDKKYLVW